MCRPAAPPLAPAPASRQAGRRNACAGQRLADRPASPLERDLGVLMPALPLDEAGKYVAAAYVVFIALILIYVAIMAAKLARIDRELSELADIAERKAHPEVDPPGADAGAERNAGGEAEGNMFERERSSREELV